MILRWTLEEVGETKVEKVLVGDTVMVSVISL